MVSIRKPITVQRHNNLDFFSELSDYSDGNLFVTLVWFFDFVFLIVVAVCMVGNQVWNSLLLFFLWKANFSVLRIRFSEHNWGWVLQKNPQFLQGSQTGTQSKILSNWMFLLWYHMEVFKITKVKRLVNLITDPDELLMQCMFVLFLKYFKNYTEEKKDTESVLEVPVKWDLAQ